jgi:cystathionine beta-lyase/cystathionine gamma-synthase
VSEAGGDIRLAAIRAGALPASGSDGADLVAPPSLSSVRSYPDLDALDAAMEADPRVYRRFGNDSVGLLESTLAALETLPGGPTPVARVTASGQAALALLASASMMSGRRRVVLVRPCYGGTESLLHGPLAALGVATTVVDLPPPPATADAGALVAAAVGPEVAVVVVEIVTNPLLGIVDVPAVAAAAHDCGAVCLVDSTFTTPFLFQPLAHGADLVLHSLTKHLAGHSDVLGGVALAAADSEAAGWLDAHSRALGAVLSPFDAWLTLRGLRTAPLRVERGNATARALALALADHPGVLRVHHPVVGEGADAALAARLLPNGAGPMLSLDVRGGRQGAGRVVRALGGIRLAPSLGDVSTTVSHPGTTSHRHLSAQAREALGISDGLLRFSIGIEDEATLRSELQAALDAAT